MALSGELDEHHKEHNVNMKLTTGNWLLSALLVASVWSAERSVGAAEPQQDKLLAGFQSPPHEAKPWVYWWFQGGYGNPQGMARDIAAMKEKGIGGVMHMQTINAGGLPVPKEPKMLGPEWDAWFGEALRLASSRHDVRPASWTDGRTAAGGSARRTAPSNWCTAKHSRRSGEMATPLPQPFTRLDLYHDVAVVAFKETAPRPPMPREVKANNVQAAIATRRTGRRCMRWTAIRKHIGDRQTLLAANPRPCWT